MKGVSCVTKLSCIKPVTNVKNIAITLPVGTRLQKFWQIGLVLKAVFLALQEFQDLCTDKIVLVATDNTTVVSYINKEEGMRSCPLCALLSILTWCTRKQVTLKARHIPGRLNVVADKLSRLGQTIQQSGLSFQRSSKQYAARGTCLK